MIPQILKLIDTHDNFLVAAHRNPDGDAIASTLALGNALKELGKKVTTYNGDPVPLALAFLPGAADMVQTLGEKPAPFDLGFILDSGELSRAGDELRDVCRLLVNIDHHRNSEPFGDLRYLDQNACSTGILVYRILKGLSSYRFSAEVAACVYAAILSDTGSFRFANTDREALTVAGEMLETGINPATIASNLYENQEARKVLLLGYVLRTLKLSSDGRIASVAVSLEEMEKTATTAVHTDGFINYPRSIRGVDVALLFRQEQPRRFKVGFRSKEGIDVGSLARSLGGGGHANASGATLEGTLEEVENLVVSRVNELISPSS